MMTVREIFNLYEYYNQQRQQNYVKTSNCNGQIISSDDDEEGIPDAQYMLEISSKTENITTMQNATAKDCENDDLKNAGTILITTDTIEGRKPHTKGTI